MVCIDVRSKLYGSNSHGWPSKGQLTKWHATSITKPKYKRNWILPLHSDVNHSQNHQYALQTPLKWNLSQTTGISMESGDKLTVLDYWLILIRATSECFVPNVDCCYWSFRDNHSPFLNHFRVVLMIYSSSYYWMQYGLFLGKSLLINGDSANFCFIQNHEFGLIGCYWSPCGQELVFSGSSDVYLQLDTVFR